MKLKALTALLLVLTSLDVALGAAKCASVWQKSAPKPFVALTATPEEIAALKDEFPLIELKIQQIAATVGENAVGGKAFNILQIVPGILFGTGKITPAALLGLPKEVKGSLLAVHNALRDTPAFREYLKTLLYDVAVEMSKNREALIRELGGPQGQYRLSAKPTVTKLSYLEAGNFDHQALMKVLIHRVRARNESMVVLQKNNKMSSWETGTKRYGRFFEVPRQGPFLDRAFVGSSHGQDAHLIQMDYLSSVISRATNGNPKIFYNYVTSPKGTWAWDGLFDSFSKGWMSPEYVNKELRVYLPLM
ncbi:MAG: hypothetical protein V4736_06890 [Bdellovibrionota bacterium]